MPAREIACSLKGKPSPLSKPFAEAVKPSRVERTIEKAIKIWGTILKGLCLPVKPKLKIQTIPYKFLLLTGSVLHFHKTFPMYTVRFSRLQCFSTARRLRKAAYLLSTSDDAPLKLITMQIISIIIIILLKKVISMFIKL